MQTRRSFWRPNAKQVVQSGLTVITAATVSLIIAKWGGATHMSSVNNGLMRLCVGITASQCADVVDLTCAIRPQENGRDGQTRKTETNSCTSLSQPCASHFPGPTCLIWFDMPNSAHTYIQSTYLSLGIICRKHQITQDST